MLTNKTKKPPMENDLVDQLINDWAHEMPALDTEAMGVVGRVLRLGRIFEARANAALKPFGLNYTDLDVLATLRRSGAPYRLTPKELMRSVLITSGAMTAALDRLTAAGLMERVANAADRRSTSAQLTEAGVALIEKAIIVRFKEAADAVGELSVEDRRQLERLLRKLSFLAD